MALYLYAAGSEFEEIINKYLIQEEGINAYNPRWDPIHPPGMNLSSPGDVVPFIAANDTAEVEGNAGVKNTQLFGSPGNGTQGQDTAVTSGMVGATGTASPSGNALGSSSVAVPAVTSGSVIQGSPDLTS